jgi:hypothetical protein
MADSGQKICAVPPQPPFMCSMDSECNGYGKCTGDDCVCQSDADCTSVFADKCKF